MRNALEQILRNLCATDTEIIKKATADLNEAYKNENTVMLLCDIAVSCPEPQIRQYAAVLLSKRLSKLRSWLMIKPEQQQAIKVGMLSAVVQEREKSVRNAIVRFIGVLMRHNNNDSGWIAELLQFVYSRCSSSDANEAELGSSIFAKLTDTAPDQFVPHMESIATMLSQALEATEISNNMATPVIANIIVGMNYLMPFIAGHTAAEHTLVKCMPLILKAMHAFAYSPMTDQFMNTFDIFHNFADYTPKFLNTQFKPIVDFCLEISSNKQLDNTVRTQGIIYIGVLMRVKKKLIVKQMLVQPILMVIFDAMSDENSGDSDDNEDDFDYFGDDSGSCLVTCASQTLDLIALNIAPDKLIPPLLLLLEPALQSQNQYRRRAGFLCMAVIAEGCSEAVCSKYLETMLNIIKVGIADQSPVVRNAAFFALGQFAEHLQPEISKYAHQILPVLLEFLHQLCEEAKNQTSEPKHISRMFYALETFCENLEDEIVPHLPSLMNRLFEAMNKKNSTELRELTLCSITAVVVAAKENIIPYFQPLVTILQEYLVNKVDDNDILVLRTQAIDSLAALIRSVGKEHFLPHAEQTMCFCLQLLDGAHEPDIRRAIYNLIGSLANIVNEGMATVFPKIMERIMDSVITMEEVTPEFREDSPAVTNAIFEATSTNDEDIDIEDTDEEEEEDEHVLGYNVNNEYLNEKDEAILCLKECCEKCGTAFLPYMQKAFEGVYSMIDHPQECIRMTSITALSTFVITLQKHKDGNAVRAAMKILLPKLMNISREDDDLNVVTHVFDTLSDIMTELHEDAVPLEEYHDQLFTIITDALNRKLACQFDDDTVGADEDDNEEDSETHEMLIQAAGNLLSSFGSTMDPQRFALYFGRAHHFFLKKLKKCKKHEWQADIRSFVYGAIAECFNPLSTYSSSYFDVFFPIFLTGLTDTDAKARQNACYGLGELVFYSEQKAYASFPVVLQALSELIAKETAPAALDNVCGAVGRLILTNFRLVPLQNVLPVFLRNLPMREDFSENETAIRVFKILFIQAKEHFINYIEQVLNITLQVLIKKEYQDDDIVPEAVELVKNIRDAYYDRFQTVANATPEINNFVLSIL